MISPVSERQTTNMKRLCLPVILCIIFQTACMKDTVLEKYSFYRPVFTTREELKSNIKSGTPKEVDEPGKMVVLGNYLFLNEVDKGIHVIDISQPETPKNISYITLPGCLDLAIKGNYLYADCYTDLVTLDISNPLQIAVKQFRNGVFPHRNYDSYSSDTSKIIKEWVRVDTVIRKIAGKIIEPFPDSFLRYSNSGQSGVIGGNGSAPLGISGSMARFTIVQNRMYAVSNNDLKVFNITTPASPEYISNVAFQEGGIETIFPFKNRLFIGSTTGMYVFDLSNPDLPRKSSRFIHAKACDPVIADDHFAYVTLSSGNFCAGNNNQLDVIDINDVDNPHLIKSYSLTSPKGLSKDGDLLLICDGNEGLKLFDAADPRQITQLKQVPGFEAMDVIALNGVAVTVAKEGIYFIDYHDPANASVISKVQIHQYK